MDCCDGAECSPDGVCVPEGCAACGELGCDVDFRACSFECHRPEACLDSCTTDDDCAAGTRCRESREGPRACLPTSCAGCEGFRPICRVGVDCRPDCQPAPECGARCADEGECGALTTCRRFPELDASFCVPGVYDARCAECPGGECSFRADTCELICGAPMPPAPDCVGCCEPCAADRDCCVGVCEEGACVPSECRACGPRGCEYRCP